MLDTIRARTHYRQGFQTGYTQGQFAVAQQVAADVRRALRGSSAARMWLNELADDAFAMARSAGSRPPWLASQYHTPTGHLLAAAGPQGAGLRGTSGHPVGDVAEFARSVGEADGRTAARRLIVRDLYSRAEQSLGRLRPAINGIPADRWLLGARKRWLAAASAGTSPLPGTHAETAHRDMAFEAELEAGLPHHHQRAAHAAARPAPGAAVGHRAVGRSPVIRPAAPSPPLHPPGPGR